MAKLAIAGGRPLRTKPFPKWPIVGEEEKKAVAEVVQLGKWGHIYCYRVLFENRESKVQEFAEEFAEYYGVDYATPVTNGSVALEVALRNASIGYGDEVITPPTTWVATNLAPVMVGADTIFVDISPDNYCIDPEKIEEAITPRTKAIIPVHIGGYLCDMDRIMEIAEKHNLIVIEDCAQAHGSRYKGKLYPSPQSSPSRKGSHPVDGKEEIGGGNFEIPYNKLVGTFGNFGCFSFEISKLMTAGEGGMVITSDKNLGDYIFGLCGEGGRQSERMFAKNKHRKNVGWNSRMTEMQAAILSVQLSRLENQKKKRVENAEYLKKRLLEVEGIKPLKQSLEQNYYSYIFKYNSNYFKEVPKQKFMEALAAEGIPLFSSPSHQPPAYRSSSFYSPRRDYSNVYCPISEKAFNEEAVGFQATWMLLGEREDMDDIIEAIIKIKENINELIP